jgi:hypothetical protein
MKPENLQFYKIVMGRKPHYIFRQESKFYVFTNLDNETRGNFSIVDEDKVEKLRNLIIKKHLRDFYPRHLETCSYETDREYREHRIRTVCYILQAQGFLFQHDYEREIIFERTHGNISYQISSMRKKTEENRKPDALENKQKLKSSKSSKLKNAKRIIGFYVDEYWEKKKKDLAEKKEKSSVFICSFCKFQRKIISKTESIDICPRCKQKVN